ncbi:hypothetical protein DQ04_20761000 [Trypanosoma grayi]|uniref:hypothetical protein n=1 Tax=Trypanosoma grayi TaxID=71804 RepID=UPI0004F44C7A|nr:hypothetical protein DQ04_20761000 [Trypanosoma grayi]KEG05535.1 hypothetical protein DQ04_20761000 [Trypanosoma grayi]
MVKVTEAATRIPTAAEKVVAEIQKAQQEASKASDLAKKYRTEVEEANKAVEVLSATNVTLSAATKADEAAKKVPSGTAIPESDCNELKNSKFDGSETLSLGVQKMKGARVRTPEDVKETDGLEALMKAAVKHADNAVELAKTEKSTAEAELRQAITELEAAEKKQKESEKQKEEILESEVSERDEQKGLNRPHQPDTTDATSNPPAGALLPKTDGTADGEKLLAQHTDGSDVPAWVRAPLMLLLMACVAVL